MHRIAQILGRWLVGRRPPPASDRVLIVKKGMSAEYYSFCEILAKSNRVLVLFDRRAGERRVSSHSYLGPERRRGTDRRRSEPSSGLGNNVVLREIATENAPLLAPERLSETRGSALELPQKRATAHL